MAYTSSSHSGESNFSSVAFPSQPSRERCVYGSFSTIVRIASFSCSLLRLLHLPPCKELFHALLSASSLFLSRLSSTVLLRSSRLPHLLPDLPQSIPKYFAETGLFRLVTGHCHDSSMLSSCCIESVHRISQKYLIQYLHTLYITGSHAKYDKWLLF